jgi:hypothetical protein
MNIDYIRQQIADIRHIVNAMDDELLRTQPDEMVMARHLRNVTLDVAHIAEEINDTTFQAAIERVAEMP